jgi:long-chain fatty acid transport protein
MGKQQKLLPALSFFALLLLGQTNSLAAGYSTSLYSASGLGNSYAGSVNGMHDASDIFFNPAVTAGLKKSQFIISASYLMLNVDPDNSSASFANGNKVTGTDSHDAGVDSVVPSFYLATPLTKNTTFNFAVTSPFGLATKYDDNWTGRYRAIESSITTININPSFAHKINDQFSVGFGFQAQYLETLLSEATYYPGSTSDGFGKLTGSDWGYGYNFGANFKLNEQWKFGLGYRSKIDYKIAGSTEIVAYNMYSGLDAKISTPESLTLGANFKATKKIELAYDLTWTRWSRLKSLTVNSYQNSALSSTTNFNWHDSLMHSVGANFTLNDKWLLRTGVAYEKDAVTDANREPRIPTADKIWLSFGFNYKIGNGFSLDSSYLHQIYRTAQINLTDSSDYVSSLSARVSTRVDVISLAIKKEF